MTAAIRIAVDAGNLVRDRRGMGRLAREIVRALGADASWQPTLLARKRSERQALRAEFGLPVAGSGAVRRRGAFDVAWYPFNAMRGAPPRVPSVVLVHDVFAFSDPHRETIARFREQRPIRRAIARATTIATTTQFVRAEIERVFAGTGDRIVTIAPEADPFFKPGIEALPSSIAGMRCVLVVGAREARKNVAMLLHACADAFEGPGDVLVVAGGLTDADAALARSLRVRALAVDASDEFLRTLYRTVTVVAVPSRAEGFGLVAVEAMTCGAGVIAADGTGLRESCAGAATLVAPGDVHAWATEIRAVFTVPERLAALRQRARKRFTYAPRGRFVRETLALLAATAATAARR